MGTTFLRAYFAIVLLLTFEHFVSFNVIVSRDSFDLFVTCFKQNLAMGITIGVVVLKLSLIRLSRQSSTLFHTHKLAFFDLLILVSRRCLLTAFLA